MNDLPDEPIGGGKPSRARRLIGFVLGVGLLGVAVWVVASNRATLTGAYGAAKDAPALLLVAAALLPLAHWHLTSVVFWILTRRHGAVRLGEMHLLIGAAGLLNYLPLRPGMFGRFAYHKRVNGIRVKDSVGVALVCLVLTAVATMVALAVALACREAPAGYAWAAMASPAAVFGLIGFGLAGAGGAFSPRASVMLALAVRHLDIVVWIVRYAVAFTLVGHPIAPFEAAVFVAAAQLAMLVPFVGAGLGVREWGIGLTLPVLDPGAAKALGLAGDLLNRAAEVLVATPVGLVCLGILARRGGMRGPARAGGGEVE